MNRFAVPLLCLVSSLSYAQPLQNWLLPVHTDAFHQRYVSHATDPDGNVFVIVTSAVTEFENSFRLVKMDSFGTVQWSVPVGQAGDSDVVAKAMAADRLGNVVIVGTKVRDGLDHAFWHKFNGAGVLASQGTVAESGARTDPDFRSVVFDHTNQFTAVGIVRVLGQERAMTMRRGIGNELRFQRFYANVNYQETNADVVRVDAAGNVYVAGDCRNSGGTFLPFILSYTPSGAARYARSYVATGDANVVTAELDKLGRLYVAMKYTEAGGVPGHAVLQLTSTGATGWFRKWAPAAGRVYFGGPKLGVLPEGGAVVAGYTYTNGNTDDRWEWSTYRANGQQISQRTRPTNDGPDSFFGAIPVDQGGNAYLVGDGTAPASEAQGGTIQQQFPTGIQGWAVPALTGSHGYVEGASLDRFGNLVVGAFRWVEGVRKVYIAKHYTFRSLSSAGVGIPAGGSKTITVNFALAAPAGGARVTLVDNSARLVTPASVLVPAGQRTATFLVRATAGGATAARVTGQYAGRSFGLSLAITGG